jgi:thioredoxin reductase (NADPH)
MGDLDCLIIGGGPAGLTAAVYLARFHRRALVVDAGDSRAALIPATHNYPGFAGGLSGVDLLAALRAQAKRHDVAIQRAAVAALHRSETGFVAEVDGKRIASRKILLATGIVDEHPQLPSLARFIYRGGLRFCPICDAYEATDKHIAVIGPLPHAVKKAVFLRTYSKRVSLLALGDVALGAEEHQALREAGIAEPTEPVADLDTEGDRITAVMASGRRVTIDVLYPAMGARVRSELATGLGASCNEAGCLYVDDHQRTSVPDLYAAGDVTIDLHQISVATGQGAVAATDIHNTLSRNYR